MNILNRYSKRTRNGISEFSQTRTKQSFKEECDINNILRKYSLGIMPESSGPGQYGDFSNVADYQTAVQSVMDANSAFAALPSQIRHRFEHDPTKLLAFLHDAKNRDEAIRLGLIPKPHTEAPVASEPAPEPKAAKKTNLKSD